MTRLDRRTILALTLLLAAACGEPSRAEDEHVSKVRKPLPAADVIAKLPADGGPEFNRLVFESSPYLRQHARNPVDWYPWGQAAFEKAARENKPIFLSIGYSTCHWCHVMEHESFEDKGVAKLLNDHFVAVKVDREERPDVDGIYMSALQAMTRRGGWPLSMFMTPARKPFFGGTYWPKDDSGGRMGFVSILKKVHALWTKDRPRLEAGAERLTQALRDTSPALGAVGIGAPTLAKAVASYSQTFDEEHGGFGRSPKFPRSHSLMLLLRQHARAADARTLTMVETTLDRMARGGLRDHLAGGFHRYSTDAEWLVPHFEKMLYDQALLARTYVEAYQVTGKARYARIARETLDFVLRELDDPAGGFHSAYDADSEGVEGKVYVWTRQEILTILGEADGTRLCAAYGVTPEGNFKDEATGKKTGANILHLPKALTAEQLAGLAPLRAKLLAVRVKRIPPQRDDKVLTDWNGLMIGSLAYAGRALGEPRYVAAAQKAAEFVLGTMRTKQGRLLHVYRAGRASQPAFLDDHAFLAWGLLELYEATFDARWLAEAKGLADTLLAQFWDTTSAGFWFRAGHHEALIARSKEIYDGAIPSGNSVAALVLLRLGQLTQQPTYARRAEALLAHFSGLLDKHASGFPFALLALDFLVGPKQEIVLAGKLADLAPMRTMLYQRYLPRAVLVGHVSGDAGAAVRALVPFVANQTARDGQPTAYVCRDHACQLPTTDAATMLKQISEATRVEPPEDEK